MVSSLFFCLMSSSISVSSSLNASQNPSKTPKPTQFERTNHNPNFASSKELIRKPNALLKMPPAPWMKGPILLQPNDPIDPTKTRKNDYRSKNANAEEKTYKALSRRESGVRGKKAMKKIIRNIEKLKDGIDSDETQMDDPEELELPDCLDPIGNDDVEMKRFGGKMPWYRAKERFIWRRTKKEKVVTSAELSLDKDLLERLRSEAKRMKKWVKVMKAGVTDSVVDEIRVLWRRNELVMVRFDLPLCRNMDRAQEIIEMKTGGLVVLSKKDFLVVYRGTNYRFPSRTSPERKNSFLPYRQGIKPKKPQEDPNPYEGTLGFTKVTQNSQPITASLYEREADRLLDGLGPRYIDWWMRKPLPVDGDLLPEVVWGFRPPVRRCPPGTRAKLSDDELTYLRKLAHPLPFHFVLGRNRGLQGLALAVLKLWEKCIIAKIAVKWGVPNTNNEQMAEELKHLTGGVLILRNKYIIVLFRGKDFLPGEVANLVNDRESIIKRCQLFEENERQKEIETLEVANDEPQFSKTGTLSEFQEIQRKFGEHEKVGMELEAEKAKLQTELRKQERRLYILKLKIEKSATELFKLNSEWKPSERDEDVETLTSEEKECLRKIGLRMSSSLVLGRRGIFDGVVEGLHQHWKHREVAKVITMQRVFSRVVFTAKSLEAESGGILVSIEKLKEGHALIIYRGKNYRRPPKLMTQNLLNKREALLRSLELQRFGSLKFFAYQRERKISDLKLRLAELDKRMEDHLEGSQAKTS